MKKFWLLSILGFLLPVVAAEPPGAKFFAQHCTECHDAETKKGGLDLTALRADFTNVATFSRWVKVHDRVQAGEMPPKKKSRPSAKETAATLKTLREALLKADAARLESVLAHLDGVQINAEVRAQILRAGPSELHATVKALSEEQRKAVEARASALAAELLASVGHRQPLPADHPAKTQTNGSDLEARYQDHLRKVSSSRRPA